MDKFYENLIILKHFYSIIKYRTDYCKKHIDFSTFNHVGKLMNFYIQNGIETDVTKFKEEPYLSEFAEQASDIRLAIHNYLNINIIDIFSFDTEYNSFFNLKIQDTDLKSRIEKVKNSNTNIRKQLNWDELKKIRNTVLAHNLRDKKSNYNFDLESLIILNQIVFNFEEGIRISSVILEIYENIEKEFKIEIIEAEKYLENQINKMKKRN